MNYKNKLVKKPWPTKDAMVQIYEQNLWGQGKELYYSGEGSHLSEIVNPYLREVTKFLRSFQKQLDVCDLGCGDFNIGKQLVIYSNRYFAVDIVPDLISHNESVFKKEGLTFHCLDISKDKLPQADCLIIRQVLQHLSNAEVMSLVKKIKYYKYVILTEHLPLGDFEPNVDIISGQGIRLKKGSGIKLTESPFNLLVKEEKLLHTAVLQGKKGIIQTMLYETFKNE